MRLRPLLAALALAAAPALAQTPPASAASAPTIRAEVAPPLQAAQKALNEKHFEEALRQVQAAAAVPGLTPYETFAIQRFRALAADNLRDHAQALEAYTAVLGSEYLEANLRGPLAERAANAAYALKDYERTVSWSQRALDAGTDSTLLRLRMAQAQHFAGRHAAAAQALADLAARQQAAGEVPGEPQLRLGVAVAAKIDEAAYGRALEALLARHPRPEVWADRLSRLSRQPGFDDRLALDVLRLGHAAGAWTTPEPWVALAEGAQRAGFVAEAAQVVEAGFARGLLGQGAQAAEHQALRERLQRQARADLPPDAKAAGGRDAAYQFSTGWDLYTRGQAAEGIALMQQAVQRGLPKQADDARLRLAGALVASGRGDEARPLLTALAGGGATDGLADLARLWLLRAGAKG